MNTLYPLQFTPIPKERVWGGSYIAKHLRPHFPIDKNIGESWELCGLEENVSEVCNGFLEGNEINELIEVYMGDLVGDSVYHTFAQEFPLLVKFLDINDYLSIQVHPSNEIAKERHNAYGKAEIWYVLHAEPDARMYLGFNRQMTPGDFHQRCLNQTLPEVLNEFTPQQGDYFYIPPGTVHAAGGGLVIAEIQQVSDITYRVYDWGREFGPDPREMHLELALDIINYEPYIRPEPLEPANPSAHQPVNSPNSIQSLIRCPYFNIDKKTLSVPVVIPNPFNSSFRLLICVEGAMELRMKQGGEVTTLKKGGLTLIPASIKELTAVPLQKDAAFLEVWLETD